MKCNKTAFANEKQADFYIKKLKDTSTRSVKPTRSYLCPACLLWHLTSQTSKDDSVISELQSIIKKRNETITKLNGIINELRSKK